MNKKILDSLNDIEKESKTINIEGASEEILTWLNNNVENYIDNQTKIFKIDLIIKTEDGIKETQKLQDLYYKLSKLEDDDPSSKKSEIIIEYRKKLDNITEKIYLNMKSRSDLLSTLFDRMVFYYEKIIPNPESKNKAKKIDEEIRQLIKDKDASNNEVEKKDLHQKILDKIQEGMALLKYDTLKGAVDIIRFEYEAFEVKVQIKDKNTNEINKEYVIPEGFVLWLQIEFASQVNPTSLF